MRSPDLDEVAALEHRAGGGRVAAAQVALQMVAGHVDAPAAAVPCTARRATDVLHLRDHVRRVERRIGARARHHDVPLADDLLTPARRFLGALAVSGRRATCWRTAIDGLHRLRERCPSPPTSDSAKSPVNLQPDQEGEKLTV